MSKMLHPFEGKSWVLRAFATSQERRNKPESSAAKLYCLLRSKRGRAWQREAERKRERDAEREAEREAESRGREQRKRRRERDEETKRGSARTPSLLRRIILRLGRVTPWLAAAHRPSCHHEKGRAHGGENCPCTCADYLLLRTQLSVPSYNGKCECGSPQYLNNTKTQ